MCQKFLSEFNIGIKTEANNVLWLSKRKTMTKVSLDDLAKVLFLWLNPK